MELRVPLHTRHEARAAAAYGFHQTVVRAARFDDKTLGQVLDPLGWMLLVVARAWPGYSEARCVPGMNSTL